MKSRVPRLKDVAEALGLSINAVSKALRDAPDISEATKERVKREAIRVGYVPDLAARRLRSGTGGGIGFLAPDLGGPGVVEMLLGLEQAAARAGLPVVIATAGINAESEWAGFRRLLGQQVVRAVIVGSPGTGQRSPLLREAAARQVPLVYLNQFPATASQYTNVGRITADWIGAGRLAVEAVVSRGHRHVGYLAGRVSGSAWAEHFQGVMAAVEGAGLPSVHTVFTNPESMTAGKEGARELLKASSRITAIICAGDRMAFGVLEALREVGRADSVAVVGCGGLLWAKEAANGFATVQIPWPQLGQRAGEMLLTSGGGKEERLEVEWKDGPSLFSAR
ncbi:MAG: LacI family DNA-binding transcriptional regulator [Candidatus Methylacidiphilales bacterium]